MREPRRLTALPTTGRVLIAHPDDAAAAIERARENLCDYKLNFSVEPGDAYVVNVDQLHAL